MDEDAYNALRESKIELPQLPIKSTRITTAIGNKSSPIKKQIYAPLEIGGKVYDYAMSRSTKDSRTQ